MHYQTAEQVLREANQGLVSINEELKVCEGYDGQVDPHWYDEDGGRLPPAERVKLAEAMIARWQKYRAEAASHLISISCPDAPGIEGDGYLR